MFGITEFQFFALAVVLILWVIHHRLTSIKTLLELQRADDSKRGASISALAKTLEAISAHTRESSQLLYVVRNLVSRIDDKGVKLQEPVDRACDRLSRLLCGGSHPMIGAPMHAARFFGERLGEAEAGPQAHPDLPDPSDAAKRRRFPLALVAPRARC
jgi:hypothetical protein